MVATRHVDGRPDGPPVPGALFREAGPETLAATAAALDAGELQAFDVALDLAGSTRQLEARIAPSGPSEVTAIIRDFTTQRNAEAELRRSRARIVEAADAERRRLESAICTTAPNSGSSRSRWRCACCRSRLAGADGADPGAIAAADGALAAEVKLAGIPDVLRELARGIHPAILTEAGPGAGDHRARGALGVPVSTVETMPDRRLPPAVEATAYFVVSEALANVGKYASAVPRRASPRHAIRRPCASRSRTTAIGGADQARGTGIRGLQDRVAALGGRLTVASPLGEGTRITAEDPDRLATAPRGGGPVRCRGYWTVEFVNVIVSPRKKIPG